MERLGQYLLETLPNYKIVSFGKAYCHGNFLVFIFLVSSHITIPLLLQSCLHCLSFGSYKMQTPFAYTLLHMWFTLTGVYILVSSTFPLKLSFNVLLTLQSLHVSYSFIYTHLVYLCKLELLCGLCTPLTVGFVEIITFSVGNMSRANLGLYVAPPGWGSVTISELCI